MNEISTVGIDLARHVLAMRWHAMDAWFCGGSSVAASSIRASAMTAAASEQTSLVEAISEPACDHREARVYPAHAKRGHDLLYLGHLLHERICIRLPVETLSRVSCGGNVRRTWGIEIAE